MDILDELSIDIVISPDVPHRVYDYALYVALTIKNKKLLTFQSTPFGDASIVIDETFTFPIRYKNIYNKSIIENKPSINNLLSNVRKKQSDYKLDYMENKKYLASLTRLDKFKSKLKYYLQRFISKEFWVYFFKKYPTNKSFEALESGNFPKTSSYKRKWYYWVKYNKLPENSWWPKSEMKKTIKKRSLIVSGFEKRYRNLVDFSINLKKSYYVAVALHYQPKATTCPAGGVFVDQLLIIEMLDKLLPKNIEILVKEHISQFYNFTESASGRSNLFYDRLNKFSNRVKYLDPKIPSFDVIDNSLAIVTVSGTIGFEALARGKPVLVFGRTWYEYAPGAFRIKTAKDLLIAYNSIIANDKITTTDEFDNYIKNLSNYFVYGTHSGSYIMRSKRSREESVQNIVAGLTHYLEPAN